MRHAAIATGEQSHATHGTQGIDILDGGVLVLIHHHVTFAVQLHTDLIQTQFGMWGAANSQQHCVELSNHFT